MDKRTDVSLPLDIAEQAEAIIGEKVGYARVSSKDQNLERQTELLRKEGVFSLYKDQRTGSTRQRPGLEEALRYVRKGDQLIVVSMDRLARSLSDLYSIVDDLTARGVSVKFLKEGQTYSKNSTPVAKLMLGLLGSVAEFERSIIRERQAEGIAQAKKRGVYKGRAKALTTEQVQQAKSWITDGIPKAEVARRLGIGRTTLYKYLNPETLKSPDKNR
ncbi:recombinase family protein [Corynebacterium auriscanis]|uniref:recombinase family protein n=1 Tax=Corynebacterium auriscanis TaxID=99807 RepID=UPI003CF8BE5D